MTETIMQAVAGLIIIVLGILNMKGNISLLHSYHRKKVKDEDIRPFGRIIGIGTIIVGITIIAAGVTGFFSENAPNIVLIAGFVPGFGLILYALLKYNKGIF